MTTTLAVTEAIDSIRKAESTFNLKRIEDPQVFPEWYEDLPALSHEETNTLDRIQKSYLYNSADGILTESTVNLLLVSPLLYLAGFFEPPFKIRAEKSVEISGLDNDITLKGRIDVLVLQDQLWLMLVESKQAKFSFSAAIPQALTYMMANPNPERPIYGMATNGDNFIFIKLIQQPTPQYDLSNDFSLFARPQNELYQVLQILKRIGSIMP
jgi:Type I restriction enzyme R protein N terminus (HSDR_N)